LYEKTSPTGTVLWTQQFGNGNSDNAFGLACDSLGNIYVSGTFLGTVYFGTNSLNSPISNSNFFVIKIAPNGDILWRKTIPGYSAHKPKLTVDNNDNLFLTGVSGGTRNFGAFTIDSDNGYGFVCKLNTSSGNVIWVTQFGAGSSFNGTPVTNNITTSNFIVDTLGNIFLTGCFIGHGRFGSQNIISSNSGSDTNAYLMKMSPTGTILWTKFSTGKTEGTSIVLDQFNNIYTAGNYFGQVSINNTTYTAPTDKYSIYLGKHDSEGNLIWFKHYDINTTAHHEAIPQLAIDKFSNLFFKCQLGFNSTVAFENQTFNSLVGTNPNRYKTQLLASFNGNGDNLWVDQFETFADNSQYGIWPDRANNIAVDETGLYFTSANTLFDDVSHSLQSGANIFTAKLTLPYVLANTGFDNAADRISIVPNPTTGILNIDLGNDYSDVEVNTYNSLGQQIGSKKFTNIKAHTMDLTGDAGLYFIEIKTDRFKAIRKVIKF